MHKILNKTDADTLSVLLEQTGRSNTYETRSGLLKLIDSDMNMFGQSFEGWDARSFSINFVDTLNDRGNREGLLTLVDMIAQNPRNNSDVILSIYRLRKALALQNVHIITGTKGGIGKTLVGLAVACYYYYGNLGNKSLLAVDLNSTNPDLFRILSYYKKPKIPFKNSNSLTSVLLSDKLRTVRPHEPHYIKGGAASFWYDIWQICDDQASDPPQFDVIVDTCWHVANLVQGRQDIPEELRNSLPRDLQIDWTDSVNNILNSSGRTIYIWIFWTWANFQDTEIESINSALTTLSREFGNRVTAVHVLNPSALLLPKIKLAPTAANLQREIRKLQQEIDRVSSEYGTSEPEYANNYIQNLEKNITITLEMFEQLPKHVRYAIPGLFPLIRTCNSVPSLPYLNELPDGQSFTGIVAGLFQNSQYEKAEDIFARLHEDLIDSCGGRPGNILPISTHNPDLRGYTEVFTRSRPETFDSLSENIKDIIDDIAFFLPGLAPVNSVIKQSED